MNKIMAIKVVGILVAIPIGAVLAGIITYQIGKSNPTPETSGPVYWLSQVGQKVSSIIIPSDNIGNLTPARDIRGRWVSSLSKKGIQLFGQFTTGPGTTKIYEDGDIELIITDVNGNDATGTIRYYNLCSWGQTTAPGIPTVSIPKQCGDTAVQPITINVSGSRVDFGTVNVEGATATMQGSFTTSLMSGSTSITTSYGVIKGQFKLMKVD